MMLSDGGASPSHEPAAFASNRPYRTTVCTLAMIAGLANWAVPAAAQSAAPAQAVASKDTSPPSQPDTGQIEDIVVTAQRRDERLQSVPVSISAFTATTLQSAGITDTTSLQTITPGLVVSKSLAASTPFIRGIGSTDLGPSSESSVAVYVDGIYLVAAPSALFSFNNIERIEVLKGPQGTLFGRNATGGLIQIITRSPTDNTTGRYEVGYGSHNTFTATGYLSSGLGGGFSFDAAGAVVDQKDGWGRNLFNGRDVGKTSEIGGRVKLRWRGPSTDIVLSALYNDRESDTGVNIQPYRGGGAGRQPGGISFVDVGKYNINNQLQPLGTSKTFVPSLFIKQDLGFASLVSISSYQKSVTRSITGPDALPRQISDADIHLTSKAGTQEFQLLSPATSNFKWILGAFALVRNGSYDPSINYLPVGVQITEGRQITRSYSAYAQGTMPIGDATNVTGGLRYTRDNLSGRVQRRFNGIATGPLSEDKLSFGKLTWRAAIDHEFSSDLMAYASYNRGYKSGLFNLLNYPLSAGRARPETVDAYEVGFKSDLLNRKLRFNASAFLYNYSDLQVFFFLNGTAFTLNADKARIYGVEAEVTARPTPSLTIRGGITYLAQAKYIMFSTALRTTPLPGGGNSVAAGPISGGRMARTPDISANIGTDFTMPTAAGKVDFNLTASYQSKFFWLPEARLFQPGYVLLNAQAKLHVTERAWLTLWGRNLTDKYYYAGGQSNPTGDVGSPAAPRTYGVSAGYAF